MELKKNKSPEWWLLATIIIGDGAFVVLQVPSPSFFGFGLTPYPLLITETLVYLLAGYLAFRLKVYSYRGVYFASFALVILSSIFLAFIPLPTMASAVLNLVLHGSLAILNLCWGICFSAFKPSISIILVIGAYALWASFSLAISFALSKDVGSWIQMLIPLCSLILLGFCLSRLGFGPDPDKRTAKEVPASYSKVIKSVAQYCAVIVLFCAIFGSIMQMDLMQGLGGFIVSPEAQIASIAVTLALLVYTLLNKNKMSHIVIIAVPFLLATLLVARALLADQSFLANSFPMVLFNFFGLFVWVVFSWKGYESSVSPFCIFSLGLGSMRLGLLIGRLLISGLAGTIGLSSGTVKILSLVCLWVLFIAVLAVIYYILRRNTFENLPFEDMAASKTPTLEDVSDSTETPASQYEQRFAQVAEEGGLSKREAEVLQMFASGRSSTYIAEELFLSHYTIKSHLRRCYTKLGIHSRQELLDLLLKDN